MSDEKDWAEKIAKDTLDDVLFHKDQHYEILLLEFSKALREARKIEWPDENLVLDVQQEAVSHAKNMDDLFAEGVEWLKAWVEGRRK